MLYASRFVSDRDRDPELWATIWQAKAPPTLNLIGAYNPAGNPGHKTRAYADLKRPSPRGKPAQLLQAFIHSRRILGTDRVVARNIQPEQTANFKPWYSLPVVGGTQTAYPFLKQVLHFGRIKKIG